jgi:hypothetical protein
MNKRKFIPRNFVNHTKGKIFMKLFATILWSLFKQVWEHINDQDFKRDLIVVKAPLRIVVSLFLEDLLIAPHSQNFLPYYYNHSLGIFHNI